MPAARRVLVALVLLRQIHLWTAGVLLAAAWLGPAGGNAGAGGPASRRFVRATFMAFAAVPAVALLGWFVHLWHGLVVPTFQAGEHAHQGPNPAVPAMVLAVAGVWGIFYTGFLAPRAVELRRQWRWLLFGAVAAAVVASVPHTGFDQDAGRWSGLWNVVRRLPTFADRSPPLVAMAALGGATLVAWSLALPRRDGWLFLVAWAGFTAAHTANREAWHRYYEPFTVVVFSLAAARVAATSEGLRGPDRTVRPRAFPRWAPLGPLTLAAFEVVVTVVSLR